MDLSSVLSLIHPFESTHIPFWVDGGWGVDALLGHQTRPHSDLDIVIQQQDLPTLRTLLSSHAYRDVDRPDTVPWNFVLGDPDGRLLDVHAIVFDDQRNGLYGSIEKGVMYPAASLTGTGIIGGYPVNCISPEYMVKFHTGYPLRESDFADVSALCLRFKIEFPEEYTRFRKLLG